MMHPVAKLRFDNKALRVLPLDRSHNAARRPVPAVFALCAPTPLPASSTRLVACSRATLALLGCDADEALAAPQFPQWMAGNELLPGAKTAAHCYCGHQFGGFAGQLGDGAAMYLGEVVGYKEADADDGGGAAPPAPRAEKRWELQLKGAGPTPFSRTADGRKVLRSTLREYLMSQAAAGLGIPTTRAATIVVSAATVERDPLYTGRVKAEKCAVVSRVAETFLRFGSFQICTEEGDRAGPCAGDTAALGVLFDYVASEHFPEQLAAARRAAPAAVAVTAEELAAADAERVVLSDAVRRAAAPAMIRRVAELTARTVAAWQCVGFCHGVLNTDNMSIIGLTIDYGPYAMMTHFDKDFVCNASDNSGRYAYRKQPEMCLWNLGKLAEAWALLFDDADGETATLHAPLLPVLRAAVENAFTPAFDAEVARIMAAKLGVLPFAEADKDSDEAKEIAVFVDETTKALFTAMQETSCDMTAAFLALEAIDLDTTDEGVARIARGLAVDHCVGWDTAVRRLGAQSFQQRPSMAAQQIAALRVIAEGDPARLATIFPGAPVEAVLDHLAEQEAKIAQRAATQARLAALQQTDADGKLAADAAVWAAFLGEYRTAVATRLSPTLAMSAARLERMRGANPRFVLRPWVAEEAIRCAEAGDFTVAQRLSERLETPFDACRAVDVDLFGGEPRDADICVSCSS
jgi:uncharacterized protein YdiU (UPF0061 family)